MMRLIRFLWGPITTFVNAFVFQTLWYWFVTPEPLGLPPITYWHALGLSTALLFVTSMSSGSTWSVFREGDPEEIFRHSLVHCCVLWFLSLGVGGLAHWGM